MKSVFKLPEITKKRIFGIVVNLALCAALMINLICWQRHYQRLEPESENWQYQQMSFGMNKSVKLSVAIDNVLQIIIYRSNQLKSRKKSVLKIIFYPRKIVFGINSLELILVNRDVHHRY